MSENRSLLNIGCGNNFHPDWVNLDFVSYHPSVIKHDLNKGIPFEDNSFDVIYHSHILEHFDKENAFKLLSECLRVLKKGGVIRVVVPDLEKIAVDYLFFLNKLKQEYNDMDDYKYNWVKLELIDQIARVYSGGEMGKMINSSEGKQRDFLEERLGFEINSIPDEAFKSTFLEKILSLNADKIRLKVLKWLVSILGGEKYRKAFEIGLFKYLSGENHIWMYDSYSLSKLLNDIGFVDIKTQSFDSSFIHDFNTFQLDNVCGKIRKPDSIFIEGRKI